MRSPSTVLLAAVFAGLAAPSFALVGVDGSLRHGASPSAALRRMGVPQAESLVFNKPTAVCSLRSIYLHPDLCTSHRPPPYLVAASLKHDLHT